MSAGGEEGGVDLPKVQYEQRCLYSAVEMDSLLLFLPFLKRRAFLLCVCVGGGGVGVSLF